MKKKIICKLVVFFIVFLIGFIELNTETMAANEIKWNTYDQGLSQALIQNKKIFLYFYADWCKYCKLFEKTSFKKEKIINYLNNNYINISVNLDKKKLLVRKFGVRGVPALFFLEPDSEKISGVPGYVKPEVFLKMLKFIHTDSYKKIKFSEYSKSI